MRPLKTPPVARRHGARRSICGTLHFSRTRYFPSLGLALAVRNSCISPLPHSQRTFWSPPDYPLLKATLLAVSRMHYGALLSSAGSLIPPLAHLTKHLPDSVISITPSGKPLDQLRHGFLMPVSLETKLPESRNPILIILHLLLRTQGLGKGKCSGNMFGDGASGLQHRFRRTGTEEHRSSVFYHRPR